MGLTNCCAQPITQPIAHFQPIMIDVYPCPKGHQSTESDYCSECGSKLADTPVHSEDLPPGELSPGELSPGELSPGELSPGLFRTSASLAQSNAGAIASCPDCGTPHDPSDGIFCEICGYNFKTQAHGEIPLIAPPAPPVPQAPPDNSALANPALANPVLANSPLANPALANSPVASEPGKTHWQLEITIDSSLAHADSPPAPVQAPIRLDLTKSTYLIGRTSATRANYPDIPLDFDEAVSHRHAVLAIAPDQSLTLRDIGSSNGTYVNGVEIKPMVDIPLKAGDVFHLGHWTKITICPRTP